MDPLEVHCVAIRPRRLVVAALAAVILACTMAILLYALDFSGRGFPYGLFGLYGVLLAGWGLFSHLQQGAYGRRARGVARVDRAGLVHRDASGRAISIPRARIRDGVYRGRTLRLLGPLHRVLFEAELTEASAQATLRALGLDAASHRAEFGAASPIFGTLVGQILFGVVLVALFQALPFAWTGRLFSWPLPFALLTALAMWPSRLTAGTDGFMLRWYWWRRFVPMSAVQSIATEQDRDVVLQLTSGKKIVWYTSMRRKSTSPEQRDHRRAVLLRMREAHEVAAARPRASHLAAVVGRAGRTHEEWLAALRLLRGPEGDYRAPALPRDELWQLLEDPAAPEDARAGAAFVLRAEDASAGEEIRLRNAAGATVSPRLRIALDSAAEGNEEELEAALEEVDLGPPSLSRHVR